MGRGCNSRRLHSVCHSLFYRNGLHRLPNRTFNIEIDPRATGTHRLGSIPIRWSEHNRFYHVFYAIIFDAAER